MKVKGIRIFDDINRVISVTLFQILKEVYNGNSMYWSILYLEAIGNLGEGKSIIELEEKIYKSEKGLYISWEDLNLLSNNIDELIDIVLIGSRDKNLLHRYENDRDMYETCDIVIQMIDSSYWEIFSKDENIIKKLSQKFKDTMFLESDFKP